MSVDSKPSSLGSRTAAIAVIAAALMIGASAIVSTTSLPTAQPAGPASGSHAATADAAGKIAGMPLYFERNQGRATRGSSTWRARATTPCS